MQVSRFEVPMTTNSGGNASGFTPNFSGELLAVHLIVPGSGGISGGNIAVTSEATGEPVLSLANQSASSFNYPRAATQTVTGAASLYASGGAAVNDRIALGDDRLKIAVTAGGNGKAVTVIALVEGD